MKNNLSSIALFVVCVGLSINICAMSPRRYDNLRKMGKKFENELQHKKVKVRIRLAQLAGDKKVDELIQESPTLSGKREQENIEKRIDIFHNAKYFSKSEFVEIAQYIEDAYYEENEAPTVVAGYVKKFLLAVDKWKQKERINGEDKRRLGDVSKALLSLLENRLFMSELKKSTDDLIQSLDTTKTDTTVSKQ
ncbi:hypothetical protein KJZ61_00755 [Candidatus Dependentiae bacterium]|nr:hypothetical protein [Candidatus Dependentiae bacterium]